MTRGWSKPALGSANVGSRNGKRAARWEMDAETEDGTISRVSAPSCSPTGWVPAMSGIWGMRRREAGLQKWLGKGRLTGPSGMSRCPKPNCAGNRKRDIGCAGLRSLWQSPSVRESNGRLFETQRSGFRWKKIPGSATGFAVRWVEMLANRPNHPEDSNYAGRVFCRQGASSTG